MSPTRSGPSIDAEADRFEGRQPCSPSEPGCRMFSIDKGRAMAGRQVPWQHVPSPADEALVVAPTGLNVRLELGYDTARRVAAGRALHAASSRASSLHPAGHFAVQSQPASFWTELASSQAGKTFHNSRTAHSRWRLVGIASYRSRARRRTRPVRVAGVW